MATFNLKKTDHRLQNVFSELYFLGEYLHTIENQMEQIQKEERQLVDAEIEKLNFKNGDHEYYAFRHEIEMEYEGKVNVILPRLFRGPFFIALYSVFESAVYQIADNVQETRPKKKAKAIRAYNKGSLLDKAQQYFGNIEPKLELYSKESEWINIKMLHVLRKIYAHANGRLDMLNKDVKEDIKELVDQDIGISIQHGFILCNAEIVRSIFDAVNESLKDLISRYKSWAADHAPGPRRHLALA